VDENGRAADLAELRAIAAGDREAFARLIDRESPKLIRLVMGILGSLEEAEDIVQEAMISLWEHAARWTPDARVGTWLHTVCLNRSIDRLRRRRPSADVGALSDLADSAPPADVAMVQTETLRTVREAIDRLPDRQAIRRAPVPYPGPAAERGGAGNGGERKRLRVAAGPGAPGDAPHALRAWRRRA
jgi:RNA polymerase sigma-70 factor (ECF subfamily)